MRQIRLETATMEDAAAIASLAAPAERLGGERTPQRLRELAGSVTVETFIAEPALQLTRPAEAIGRRCVDEARKIGKRWPGDAIRLDAYDAEAGAGDFYRKCGFTEVGRASYRNTALIYFEMFV